MTLIGRHGFARVAEPRGLEAKAVHQSLDFGSHVTRAKSVGRMRRQVK